jgi:hypothetical protein
MFFFPPGIPPDVYDNYCLKMQEEKKLRNQKDELETLRQHISKTPSVSLNTMMAYGMLYTEIQKSKN